MHVHTPNLVSAKPIFLLLFVLTTTPKGATNTHKENMRQIHPTMTPRLAPFARNSVRRTINPNPTIMNNVISFKLSICT